MAAVDVAMRDNPPINNDLDNLFNYDVDDDIYKDVDTNMDLAPKPGQPLSGGKKTLDEGLGLEQEIKVRKARQPVPKLDDKRYIHFALCLASLIVKDYFHKLAYPSYEDLPRSA